MEDNDFKNSEDSSAVVGQLKIDGNDFKNKEAYLENLLSNIIGHDEQKKELLAVIDWFNHSHELKARGVSIPKGVVLFGKPGNGKSLFIKELIKLVDVPIFIYHVDEDNIAKGIENLFAKARGVGKAIVVIDELDLLIDRESRVVRVLQENLDGIENCDDILVLTATNSMNDIPDALIRNGRLEKLIHVPDPSGEEALELMKLHFNNFQVKLPTNFDEEEVALSLHGLSCVAIKAVVNDIVLRNGFENITETMIDDSIFNISSRVKSSPVEDNIAVAYHEAGHAVMAVRYPQYFYVNKLHIKGASGEFTAKEVEKDYWPYDKAIADIKISYAGLIAQKLLVGQGSRGCEDDLERARKIAYNLFGRVGYSSAWETLPMVNHETRTETEIKRRKTEKKIEKLLKNCEIDTIRYLKKNKAVIKKLGQLLFEKKRLKSSQIIEVMGNCKTDSISSDKADDRVISPKKVEQQC